MKVPGKVFISISSGIVLLLLICKYTFDKLKTDGKHEQLAENVKVLCWIMTQPKNHKIKVMKASGVKIFIKVTINRQYYYF